MGVISFVIGLPLALNMGSFTVFVDIITVYFVPLGALIAAFSFFWVMGVKRARSEVNRGARYELGEWWEPLAKICFVGVAMAIVVLQMLYHVG